MAVRASVEVEGGRPVVRRVAHGADTLELRTRAEALAAAAGPGVLGVLRSGPTADGGWELVTEHGGPLPMGHRLRTAAAVGELGASVAEALAAMHDRGVTHGRLAVEHLCVGPEGRVVLDGLAPVGGPEADDVAALVGMLVRIVDELPSTSDRREREGRDRLRRTVSSLEGAAAPRLPPARRLAQELRAARPPARPRRQPVRRPRAVVAAAAVLAAVAVVVVVRSPGRSAPAPARASSASSTVPTTTTAPRPWCVASEGAIVEAGVDGCPQSASVEGAAITVDGRRVVVGRHGDEVLVADWACEGIARPAVLRPDTGEVVVYGPVDAPGGPVVERAERIEGAAHLAARAEGGCVALLVVTADGSVRLA